MYHFFKKCPIYNKKTGKEIPIPKKDGYKHAFINGRIITYDIASESRFSLETRNMKYLGCGEILYQHTKIVPDNEKERSYATVIISARKLGIMNIRTAEILQELKTSNTIGSFTITDSRITIFRSEYPWGSVIIERQAEDPSLSREGMNAVRFSACR